MANYVKNVCGLQQFFQKGFTNLEKKTGFFLFLVVRKAAQKDAMSAEVKRCDESVTTLRLEVLFLVHLKSHGLEVVGTKKNARSFLRPLLPSAYYAG